MAISLGEQPSEVTAARVWPGPVDGQWIMIHAERGADQLTISDSSNTVEISFEALDDLIEGLRLVRDRSACPFEGAA